MVFLAVVAQARKYSVVNRGRVGRLPPVEEAHRALKVYVITKPLGFGMFSHPPILPHALYTKQ